MQEITGSVGAAALNRGNDVGVVQRALQTAGYVPGPDDGRCGRRTIGAILRAQAELLAKPDGRIDVHGPTWRHLNRPKTDIGSRPAQARSTAQPYRPTPFHAPAAHRASGPVAMSQGTVAKGPAGKIDYKHMLPLPPRDTINRGLHSPSNAEMRRRFGEPRNGYDQECRPPTNQRLIAASERLKVGRTSVTGLRPAIASLRRIMSDIQHELPDLFPHLGSAGMMCCRNVRGSSRSITNHSWGTAVDITIDGVPEPFGERDVWLGLLLIGPIFNRHGWYWGAGYLRATDCHHFECGSALLDSFKL